MYADIIKMVAVAEINRQGDNLIKKDTNNMGGDDAGGRSLKAIAKAVDTVDVSGITNPKSLRNIGRALEAAGLELQKEADKIDAGK